MTFSIISILASVSVVYAHEAYILSGDETTKGHMSYLSFVSRNTHKIRFEPIEYYMVFFFDKDFKFVKKEIVSEGDHDSVPAPAGKIARMCKELKAPVIIGVHNHPNGLWRKRAVAVFAGNIIYEYPSKKYCFASEGDKKSLNNRLKTYKKNGIILLDEIIVTSWHLYSHRVEHSFAFKNHYPNILRNLPKEVRK